MGVSVSSQGPGGKVMVRPGCQKSLSRSLASYIINILYFKDKCNIIYATCTNQGYHKVITVVPCIQLCKKATLKKNDCILVHLRLS